MRSANKKPQHKEAGAKDKTVESRPRLYTGRKGPQMDLFRNANEALKFAFNYSDQQYALSPMAKMMKVGIVGSGKGLVALSGAAQAGFIKAEVDRLPQPYRACVIARFSRKYDECKCCGGDAIVDEYKEAIARLDQEVLDRGWVTGMSLRQVRHAIIRALYESRKIKIANVADELKIPHRTAYDQKAKIWKPLRELDADAQAMIGDGLLTLLGLEPADEKREVKVDQTADQPAGMHVCPACNGEKSSEGIAFINTGENASDHHQAAVTLECQLCGGAGEVKELVLRRFVEGQKHREERIARHETLFAASQRMGIRPAELSAFEHGYKDLPKSAKKPCIA